MDLYGELLALVDALNEADLDYALCGGLAVGIHGYPRFTKDIDLLVRAEDLDRILAVVAPLGFTYQAGPMTFDHGKPTERHVRRVSKAGEDDLLTLDLILVEPAFQGTWEDRDLFSWQGRQLQVVSAVGLAQMKRLAGRPQDLLDLEKLGHGEGAGDDGGSDDGPP